MNAGERITMGTFFAAAGLLVYLFISGPLGWLTPNRDIILGSKEGLNGIEFAITGVLLYILCTVGGSPKAKNARAKGGADTDSVQKGEDNGAETRTGEQSADG